MGATTNAERAAMMPVNEGNWKSRAESMLSQLFVVDGRNDHPPRHHHFALQPENCSAASESDRPSSRCCCCAYHHHSRGSSHRDCYYSACCESPLGRAAGDDCVVGGPGWQCVVVGGGGGRVGGMLGGGGSGGPPCASLFLHWTKFVLGGAIRAYLSSPLWLALLPLALGLTVGFLAGRRGRRPRRRSSGGEEAGGDATTSSSSSSPGLPSRLYRRVSLHASLAAAYLDHASFRSSSDSRLLFNDERDDRTRDELRKTIDVKGESGVDPRDVPRHIAVIMDGNRRYGEYKYGSAARGHWDGSRTLIEFSKWCIAEGVQVLTVYAFSTENWDRDPSEVSALMSIFCKYCDELRVEAVRRGIRIRVLTTEDGRIPDDVRAGIDRMVLETDRCDRFVMNICLSYGGRGEIVNACRGIAGDVRSGILDVDAVDEDEVRKRMLTVHCCDPDIVIRTSGEERLSNFLLWQVAYSEFFFLKKHWPELRKDDLLEVIRTFARGRKRRYGK